MAIRDVLEMKGKEEKDGWSKERNGWRASWQTLVDFQPVTFYIRWTTGANSKQGRKTKFPLGGGRRLMTDESRCSCQYRRHDWITFHYIVNNNRLDLYSAFQGPEVLYIAPMTHSH